MIITGPFNLVVVLVASDCVCESCAVRKLDASPKAKRIERQQSSLSRAIQLLIQRMESRDELDNRRDTSDLRASCCTVSERKRAAPKACCWRPAS